MAKKAGKVTINPVKDEATVKNEKTPERVIPEVPKKIGMLTTKKSPDSKIFYSVFNKKNEVVCSVMIPHQMGNIFKPSWSVWKNDTLMEIFTSLDETVAYITKKFSKK